MRKFVLAEAELELFKELVTAARDGKEVPQSRLILTDRRIVLLVPRPGGFGGWLGRMLGPILGPTARALASPIEMTHEIWREEFDVVEPAGRMIVFRSKGTGYGETRFDVRPMSSAADWQRRMTDWVAGDLAAAATDSTEAIPEARARTSSRRPRS